MDILYPRCAGLDVHKKTIVACLLTPGSRGRPTKMVRTFGTMTADLLALAEWLGAAACTHVAMESTGVFWKPIYNLLEHSFTVLLVNAQHIKAVPGRKTDVKDAQWIAELLQHGLLRASFVPERAQRELRELTRYRTSLVRERASEVNRLRDAPGRGQYHIGQRGQRCGRGFRTSDAGGLDRWHNGWSRLGRLGSGANAEEAAGIGTGTAGAFWPASAVRGHPAVGPYR